MSISTATATTTDRLVTDTDIARNVKKKSSSALTRSCLDNHQVSSFWALWSCWHISANCRDVSRAAQETASSSPLFRLTMWWLPIVSDKKTSTFQQSVLTETVSGGENLPFLVWCTVTKVTIKANYKLRVFDLVSSSSRKKSRSKHRQADPITDQLSGQSGGEARRVSRKTKNYWSSAFSWLQSSFAVACLSSSPSCPSHHCYS